MNILVFGASGQVAKSLQDLSSAEACVTCLGRPDGDITSYDAIQSAIEAHKPDIIINAAAYTAVDAAETDENNASVVNGKAPGLIAEAAKAHQLPVIHYSTDYVFDGSADGAYKPNDPVSPLGAYGSSKEAGECAVRASNEKHVILRTAWVFSPFGKNFVKTMLTLGKTRDELNVVSDQIGNPTYAPDIARLTLKVASNILSDPDNKNLYGTFHLTNSGDTSWYGFASEIFRQAEKELSIQCAVRPIPSSDYPTPAKRPANSRLDNSSLETTHGVVRRHWEEALAECLQALKPEYTN